MRLLRSVVVAWAIACGASAARAEDAADSPALPDWIAVSGFGTVGAFRADSPVATVRGDNRVSSGSQDNTVFDQDSLLGVQANLNQGHPVNAGFQFISKKDIDATSRPRVQWAYLGWQPTEEFNFKLGRSVAPVFLMSDFRDVYYSQITVRPPGGVYYLNPITYNDGVSGLWEKYMDGGTLSIEGYVGKTDVEVASGDVDVPRQYAISAKWVKHGFTIRAAAGVAKVDFVPTPGGNAAQLLGVIQNAQALGLCSNCDAVNQAQLFTKGIGNRLYSLSMAWEKDGYTLQGEYMTRKTDSLILGSASGWYLLGARRFGDFTPYILLSYMTPGNETLGLTATPPANPGAAQAAYLRGLAVANATNVYGPYARDQNGFGVRWDCYKNTALKFQYERYAVKNTQWGSTGTVTFPIGPASAFDGKINAYTLNLDFIF